MIAALEKFTGVHKEMLDDRPQDERRNEGERTDEEHCANDQTREERAGHRERAGAFGDVSSDGKPMWFWWSSPPRNSRTFCREVESGFGATLALFDII